MSSTARRVAGASAGAGSCADHHAADRARPERRPHHRADRRRVGAGRVGQRGVERARGDERHHRERLGHDGGGSAPTGAMVSPEPVVDAAAAPPLRARHTARRAPSRPPPAGRALPPWPRRLVVLAAVAAWWAWSSRSSCCSRAQRAARRCARAGRRRSDDRLRGAARRVAAACACACTADAADARRRGRRRARARTPSSATLDRRARRRRSRPSSSLPATSCPGRRALEPARTPARAARCEADLDVRTLPTAARSCCSRARQAGRRRGRGRRRTARPAWTRDVAARRRTRAGAVLRSGGDDARRGALLARPAAAEIADRRAMAAWRPRGAVPSGARSGPSRPERSRSGGDDLEAGGLAQLARRGRCAPT